MTGQRTNAADLDDWLLLPCIRNSVRNIHKRSSLSQRFDFAERNVLHRLIPRGIEFVLVDGSPSLHQLQLFDWASRCSVSLSCIYMDVNGLHDLNNSEGHDKGDRMLQVVALEIREMFGKNNCYRIGGDEFLAYVTDRQDPAVRKCVKDFVSIVGSAGYSVAVGVATESAGGIDVGALCRKAEKRMYLDKEEHYRVLREQQGR